MAELTVPEFFSANAFEIKEDMIAYYEGITGKTLQPAEVEMFLFGAYCYRETVWRNNANNTALQNLLEFSTFPVLDFLVEGVGVKRTPPQKAQTKIRFVLDAGHPAFTIQAGTRISHSQGTPVFEVMEDTLVAISVLEIDVQCESLTTGSDSNGFAIGTIATLIDSFTYFDSCENIDITAGGSAEETDEQLRKRAFLAPAAFSMAGPLDAYKFHALGAHPDILDVSVEGPEIGKVFPSAGTVAIYPLTAVVPTPEVVLQAVRNACDGAKNRPDTDTVFVAAPTAVNYAIQVDLTLYNGADDDFIVAAITELLTTYEQTKGKALGLNIVREHIIALCVLEGVYKPNLILPAADVTVESSKFGNCTGVTVNVIAYTNG